MTVGFIWPLVWTSTQLTSSQIMTLLFMVTVLCYQFKPTSYKMMITFFIYSNINKGTYLITVLHVAFRVALILSSAHSAILNKIFFSCFYVHFQSSDKILEHGFLLLSEQHYWQNLPTHQFCFKTLTLHGITNLIYEFTGIPAVPGISWARRQVKHFLKLEKKTNMFCKGWLGARF